MDRKRKLIKLLDMKARGESIPFIILFDDYIWEYDNKLNDYLMRGKDYFLFKDYFTNDFSLMNRLNDEIEILDNFQDDILYNKLYNQFKQFSQTELIKLIALLKRKDEEKTKEIKENKEKLNDIAVYLNQRRFDNANILVEIGDEYYYDDDFLENIMEIINRKGE